MSDDNDKNKSEVSSAAAVAVTAEVQRALQISFPAVQHATEMIRNKMRSDNVPRFDDGVTRALVGVAIAIAKNNGVQDPEFVKMIVDEMFPTILFTAPPSKLVHPNGKKLGIVKP